MSGLVIQIIGFIASFFIIYSFQKEKRKSLLLFFFLGQVLFVIHFGLLGAKTAMAMNAVAALRTIIFSQKGSKSWAENGYWVLFFIALFWLAGFLAWEGNRSWLLVIASTFESYALWKNKTKHIRFLMIMPRPFFFSYNLIVGSYAGMLAEIIMLISIIIGIIRFDIIRSRNGKRN